MTSPTDNNLVRHVNVVNASEVNNTAQTSHDLSYQETFLLKIFGGEEGIKRAISTLRSDRLSNAHELNKIIRNTVHPLPRVDEELIQKDPLLSLVVLILNGDPAEDHLRDRAAESYIAKHPEDKNFEKGYAYLKNPDIVAGHLLINAGKWKCSNPKNEEFYDEQIAGLFHGTVAFDIGDKISHEELNQIQEKEGENPRFPILGKLKYNREDEFDVINWCSTPNMSPEETRLEDLFIPSRCMKQDQVVSNYVDKLKETSPIVQEVYGLPAKESAVVAILGPYGVDKNQFTQKKFSKDENITIYNLDSLKTLLMGPISRPEDHHFEAMMLTKKLLSEITDISALITETAAIDEYRFNRMVNRDFSSRDKLVIEEIAPEKALDPVNRLEREGVTDQRRLGATTTSCNDALKLRKSRIEGIEKNPKIDYTLYCNPSENSNECVEVAKVKNGVLKIVDGQQELYNKLIQSQ